MYKLFSVVILSFLFLGCLTVKDSQVSQLENTKGIVLFEVESKKLSKFELFYKKKTSISDLSGLLQNNITIMNSKKYHVLIIPAGIYTFSKISVDGKRYDFPKNDGFIVESGKTTYIGDLVIDFNKGSIYDNVNVTVVENVDTLSNALIDLPSLENLETNTALLLIQ